MDGDRVRFWIFVAGWLFYTLYPAVRLIDIFLL